MKDILILENQIVHYRQLRDYLRDIGWGITPQNDDEFILLISAIKVYLNIPGYESDYRDECWKFIKKKIVSDEGELQVDLIVMDNKLGGSTVCRTGLDLAQDIWDIEYDNKKICAELPILFLSRTDYGERNRYNKLKEITDQKYNCHWLMKGFLGDDTLSEPYVKTTVNEEIKKLLDNKSKTSRSENPNAEYIKIVEKVLDSDTLPTNKLIFSRFKKLLETDYILDGEGGVARRLKTMAETFSYNVTDIGFIKDIQKLLPDE